MSCRPNGVLFSFSIRGAFSTVTEMVCRRVGYTLLPVVEKEVFASMKTLDPLDACTNTLRQWQERVSMSSQKQASDLLNTCFPSLLR